MTRYGYTDRTLPQTESRLSRAVNKAQYNLLALPYTWLVTQYERGVKYRKHWEHYYEENKDTFEKVTERVESIDQDTWRKFVRAARPKPRNPRYAVTLIALGYIVSATKKWHPPLTIKTLTGDSYTLKEWGSCKDLKAELHKVFPAEIKAPSSFELYTSQLMIDGTRGSDDRKMMADPDSDFDFNLILVYTH